MSAFVPREISFSDASELANAGGLIKQAAHFIENMDATPSLGSEHRFFVQCAVRKLKEAQELIDSIQGVTR